MSTLSANLNSAATAVTTDFYKRLFGRREICSRHGRREICSRQKEDGYSIFDAEGIPRLRSDAEGIPRLRTDAEGIPRLQDRQLLLCGKITTVVVGLLGGAFALVLANMDIGSIYDQFLKFLGVLTGGLACLFLMGRFLPFVKGRAAFAGLVANYVVSISLDLLPFARKPHILLYGFFGMAVCLAVATVLSLAARSGDRVRLASAGGAIRQREV